MPTFSSKTRRASKLLLFAANAAIIQIARAPSAFTINVFTGNPAGFLMGARLIKYRKTAPIKPPMPTRIQFNTTKPPFFYKHTKYNTTRQECCSSKNSKKFTAHKKTIRRYKSIGGFLNIIAQALNSCIQPLKPTNSMKKFFPKYCGHEHLYNRFRLHQAMHHNSHRPFYC